MLALYNNFPKSNLMNYYHTDPLFHYAFAADCDLRLFETGISSNIR